MSRDKTLKSKSSLARHRNVLTRAERIATLQDTGLWTEDSTAVGLPKVIHRKASVGKKDKADKKQETDGDAATDDAEKKE